MAQIAGWIAQVRDEISGFLLPEDRGARTQVLRQFRRAIRASATLAALREDVRALCRRFPVPGIARADLAS